MEDCELLWWQKSYCPRILIKVIRYALCSMKIENGDNFKKTNSVHREQTVGRSLHMEMPSPPAVALPCATVFHSSWTYKHRCQLLIGHLLVSKLKWNTVVHGSTTARKEGISICKLLPTVCATVCHSSWMYKKQMIWWSFTCWSLKIGNWFDLIERDFEQIYLGITTNGILQVFCTLIVIICAHTIYIKI